MKRLSTLVSTMALCLLVFLVGCDRGAEERARLQKELDELKTTSLKTSSERDSLKTDLDAVTSARDKLREQVTNLTAEEKKLRGQIDELTTSSESLDAEVTKLTGSLEKLTGQLKEITDSRNQLQKDLAEARTLRDAMRIQVTELTKQRDEAVAKERQAQQRLAALMAAAGSSVAVRTTSDPNAGTVAVTKTPKAKGVKPPTIHSFASARTRVDRGQSATLTWHVSNASDIRIEPGIGSVSALGSTNVKPRETTTYTLTASNNGGKTVETYTIEVR